MEGIPKAVRLMFYQLLFTLHLKLVTGKVLLKCPCEHSVEPHPYPSAV